MNQNRLDSFDESIFRDRQITCTFYNSMVCQFIHSILFKLRRKKTIVVVVVHFCFCCLLQYIAFSTVLLQLKESIEDNMFGWSRLQRRVHSPCKYFQLAICQCQWKYGRAGTPLSKLISLPASASPYPNQSYSFLD